MWHEKEQILGTGLSWQWSLADVIYGLAAKTASVALHKFVEIR